MEGAREVELVDEVATKAEQKDCRHFLRGRCLYGDACRHRHDPAKKAVIESESDEAAGAAAVLEADRAFVTAEQRVNTLRRAMAPRQELMNAIRELEALKAARRTLLAN